LTTSQFIPATFYFYSARPSTSINLFPECSINLQSSYIHMYPLSLNFQFTQIFLFHIQVVFTIIFDVHLSWVDILIAFYVVMEIVYRLTWLLCCLFSCLL